MLIMPYLANLAAAGTVSLFSFIHVCFFIDSYLADLAAAGAMPGEVQSQLDLREAALARQRRDAVEELHSLLQRLQLADLAARQHHLH